MAEMGVIPSGAYRNQDYVRPHLTLLPGAEQVLLDLGSDPQTSGGLLLAVAEKDAPALLAELTDKVPHAARIGYVTEKQGCAVRVV